MKKILCIFSCFIIICSLFIACKGNNQESSKSDDTSSTNSQLETTDDVDMSGELTTVDDAEITKNNGSLSGKKPEVVTMITTTTIPTTEKDFVIYDNGTTTIIHKMVYDTTATTQKEGETITENPNDLFPDFD